VAVVQYSTVHIYTQTVQNDTKQTIHRTTQKQTIHRTTQKQTIHRTTKNKQYIEQHKKQTIHRTTKKYIEQHKNRQYIEQHKNKQYIEQHKNKQYIEQHKYGRNKCTEAIMPNANRNSATAFLLGQSGILSISCFHGFWDNFVSSSRLYTLWNTCFKCSLIEW
jgi:hypothetical protein